jgi:hypothetical protein
MLYLKDGIISTYFDSLPSFATRTFDHSKKLLECSPLVKFGSDWYKASFPGQGKSTNDCTVWMCMNAPASLRAARARTLTDENSNYEPRAVVNLLEGMDVNNFGAAGRNHIFDNLSKAKVVWGALASKNSIEISWE